MIYIQVARVPGSCTSDDEEEKEEEEEEEEDEGDVRFLCQMDIFNRGAQLRLSIEICHAT